MGDPERLLSVTSGVDEVERELLASIRDVGPPHRAKGEAWHAIAAQLAAATLVAAAPASAAGIASSGVGAALPKALAAKLVAVLAVSAAGVGTAAIWMNERVSADSAPKESVTEQRPVAASAPAALPPVAEKAAAAGRCVGPGVKLPSCSTPAPSATPASSENQASSANRASEVRQSDLLSAESRLITQARAELRNGNIPAAKAALDRLHAEFPKGVLIQEREVLTIELLAARGDLATARRRAQAFIKKYPESPHSTKLGRFLEKP